MDKHIKHVIIYLVSSIIISLIWFYFSSFWKILSYDSFSNKYIVIPVENFIYSIAPKESIIISLIILGFALTIIFIFLTIYEILKFLKYKRKNENNNRIK